MKRLILILMAFTSDDIAFLETFIRALFLTVFQGYIIL